MIIDNRGDGDGVGVGDDIEYFNKVDDDGEEEEEVDDGTFSLLRFEDEVG